MATISNYYSENLSNHTRVKFPEYNPRKVLEFLREHFGDNNIHQSVEQRRWVTVGYSEYIYFRDERDAMWFKLRWDK
jgi:sarcosine oxidase delta subunit